MPLPRLSALALVLLGVAACGASNRAAPDANGFAQGGLFPGETPRMRALIEEYAQIHGIPTELLHRIIQRESDYRADARNGPFYGLMQILPGTARTMGHRGPAAELLDPEVNLRYAGRYLRGAWIIADGDIDEAIGWYARGYYYEARNRCLLVETGLRATEVRSACG